MIVPEQERNKYLGKKLDDLEGRIDSGIIEKLRKYQKYTFSHFNLSVIDYLFLEHQKEKAITNLSEETNISRYVLNKIFDIYGLPRLTPKEAIDRMQKDPIIKEKRLKGLRKKFEDPEYRRKLREGIKKKWEDPEFRELHIEIGSKVMNDLWKDPEFRERIKAQSRELMNKNLNDPEFRRKRNEATRESINKRRYDPSFKKKQLEGLRKKFEDPEYRRKLREAAKKKWEDPEYRKKQSDGFKKMLDNPEYREKLQKGLHQLREDPEFIKKAKEGARRTRLNPDNLPRYPLPTINGYRNDIGFFAQSMWEANLARIFLYCDRKFYLREDFRLKITEKYKNLFKDEVTEHNIDFVTTDPRGNLVLYEIIAHPLENLRRYAILEMIVQQYSNIKIVPVDKEFYSRLKKWFKKKINSDSRFTGWETYEDNLKTNPEKYE